MRIVRTILLVALSLIGLLLVAMFARMLATPGRQLPPKPLAPIAIDADAAARRLAGAVRLRTVSRDEDPDANADAFVALQAYLRAQFPHAFGAVDLERISDRSLLLRWPGSDPKLAPAMFMAHQDVVPIAPGTEADWTHPPFDGVIADGFIWGRGAWDDKSQVLGLLEALDRLVGEGVQPRRTIYFAFGHDEETGGVRGAQQIAKLLEARGVKLEFVLDEGLMITDGIVPGVRPPAALIGAGEKGYLTLELSVKTAPGHSSIPPRRTAIGILSAAIARVEAHPQPAAIRGVAREMFETLAPEMSLAPRLLLSNLWLTAPLVRSQLAAHPSSAAMIRTTTAPTVIEGGNKENVLPASARALVNFRILPGDTVAGVVQAVRGLVDDPAVRVEPYGPGYDPLPVSSTGSPAYRRLNQAIRDVYPDAVVAPGLMIAAADSRHMGRIARDIYRFSPIHARREDLSRFHGTNERISIDDYARLIRFYHHLIGLSARGTQ